tara:strand:+ start:146 stop:925 length:780 start_codon:yes stop_codon:yes gene_type:complete
MKEVKLFLATPVHDKVTVHYMQSVFKLQEECFNKKIKLTLHMMKSSLVTMGRNLCVSEFMQTDHTHLLFIDSDILFETDLIFKMLEKKQEVLSCPYPMKLIQWDNVFDKNQNLNLNKKQRNTAGNMYPIKLLDKEDDIKLKDDMIELSHSMTGCMLIQREVFTKMIKAYPDLTIKQETVIDNELIERPHLYNFFDTYYDTSKKRYYGEDFAFSRLWRKIGGKCMALITEYITHVGEYQFSGRLSDEMVLQGLDRQQKNK